MNLAFFAQVDLGNFAFGICSRAENFRRALKVNFMVSFSR
jgi:hypothetical protein